MFAAHKEHTIKPIPTLWKAVLEGAASSNTGRLTAAKDWHFGRYQSMYLRPHRCIDPIVKSDLSSVSKGILVGFRHASLVSQTRDND